MHKSITLIICLTMASAYTNKICTTTQQQKMLETEVLAKALEPGTKTLNKPKALKQFMLEMKTAKHENQKIPLKDETVFRIMTYNVHFLKDPTSTRDISKEAVLVIKKINPDLLILQEVDPFGRSHNATDVINSPFVKSLKAQTGLNECVACNTVTKGFFGNLVLAKHPFTQTHTNTFKSQNTATPHEKRCYIYAHITLPNSKEIFFYGTHFEVLGGEGLRKKQINEIMIHDVQNHLKNKNVFIAGDFNATRKDSSIKYLQAQGFVDCFTHIGWQHPHYTNWTGKEIDFIFLSPSWDLPLAGCYVWHDATSDHLPIIMDIQMDEAPLVTNQNSRLSPSITQLNAALQSLHQALQEE